VQAAARALHSGTACNAACAAELRDIATAHDRAGQVVSDPADPGSARALPHLLDSSMQSLPPPPRIVEQVYHAILDAICDGRLAPGERLTQESVAKKLDVSRQPVGQALLLLKQQKFLSEAGRRGLMVAPLDRDFMRWIYELRLGIEPIAASLAARCATVEKVRHGEELIAQGRKAVDTGSLHDLIDADMKFHMYLYDLSGNRLFVDLMRDLWNHLRRAMREVLQHSEYRAAIWHEHAQVLHAIATRNPEGAAALARTHLSNATMNVQLRIADPPCPGAPSAADTDPPGS
jgi:DNA-binding GntR family transcriptional regulator